MFRRRWYVAKGDPSINAHLSRATAALQNQITVTSSERGSGTEDSAAVHDTYRKVNRNDHQCCRVKKKKKSSFPVFDAFNCRLCAT